MGFFCVNTERTDIFEITLMKCRSDETVEELKSWTEEITAITLNQA